MPMAKSEAQVHGQVQQKSILLGAILCFPAAPCLFLWQLCRVMDPTRAQQRGPTTCPMRYGSDLGVKTQRPEMSLSGEIRGWSARKSNQCSVYCEGKSRAVLARPPQRSLERFLLDTAPVTGRRRPCEIL
ncbi:hypothetical protein NDU88_005759 [Pleurodeles waltl]|uniref:Uncharacterized protein n=1 Tax=Pleurodeles waltl TaxID=8319 RepID=A0AAV7L415_PLEWA|nr:hypothetical protein NDU88_005759 [Pleurodeles waltl]